MAYEYGSSGCTANGNLPWDEYNQYQAEQFNTASSLAASKFLSCILFFIMAKLVR